MAEKESQKEGEAAKEAALVSYDPEIIKKQLEVQENIQKGWQDTTTKAVEAIERGMASGREATKRISYAILGLVSVALVATALLTWQGIVPGEVFAFFLGTVVGYLLSVMPFRPTR